MTNYNIYFGTINKNIPVKYRYTKKFKDEDSALKEAFKGAESLYYKNENRQGFSSYDTIEKESEITGVSIEDLYKDHINDMCRWYAIPTDVDVISTKKLH